MVLGDILKHKERHSNRIKHWINRVAVDKLSSLKDSLWRTITPLSPNTSAGNAYWLQQQQLQQQQLGQGVFSSPPAGSSMSVTSAMGNYIQGGF